MQNGHPYVTKELDAQREKQRRTLRQIPDWLFEGSHLDLIYVDTSKIWDCAYVENLIRRRIDEVCAEIPAVLEDWRVASDRSRLGSFIRNDVSTPESRVGRNETVVTVYRTQLQLASAVPPTQLGHLDDETVAGAIATLAVLFGWAEELAEDDYRDSRLEAALERVRPKGALAS